MTVRGAIVALGALSAVATLSGPAQAEQRAPAPPCNVRPPAGDPGLELTVAARLGAELTRPNDPIGIQGNVTDVVEVWNQTTCQVRISKVDPKLFQPDDEAFEIVPRGNLAAGRSMWVPWLDRAFDPDKSPMFIWIDNRPRFAVWQRAGRIHFMTHRQWVGRLREQNFQTAPRMPGVELEGGRRALHVHVSAEGQPFIRFSGASQRR